MSKIHKMEFNFPRGRTIRTKTSVADMIIIEGSKSSLDVKARVVFTFGTATKEIVVPKGTRVFNHQLTSLETNALIDSSVKTEQEVEVKVDIFFTEDSAELPVPQKTTFNLDLGNELLDPLLVEDDYIHYTEASGIQLKSIMDYGINRVIITVPKVIGSNGEPVVDMVFGFNGEVKRGRAIAAGFTEISFGPYKDSIFNNMLTVKITDTRGLVRISEKPLNYTPYTTPTINISGIERKGGLGEDLVIGSLDLGFSNPDTKSVLKNKIDYFSMSYYVGESDEPLLYGDIPLPAINAQGTSYSGDGITIPKKGGLFDPGQTYRVFFTAYDTLYPSGGDYTGKVSQTFLITTGKALMFIDELNKQIGVGTIDPKGELDVGGKFYADESYALNTIFFKLEDVE